MPIGIMNTGTRTGTAIGTGNAASRYWQHFILHSFWRRHRLHLKAKRVLPIEGA